MYKVYFLDGTIFIGGEINDSKWNMMPHAKPIVKLEYQLAKHKVLLKGYDGYNHIIERVVGLNFKGKERISKLILMVKKDRDVMSLIFDMIKNKVYHHLSTFGKEYNNKPVTGWKIGIKNGKPKSQII